MDQNERFKVISGSHIILLKDDKLLMLKRRNTKYNDGQYALVAGHLEENETLRENACRETMEEVGIELRPEELKLVHIVHEKQDTAEYVIAFFIAKSWKNEPKNLEPEKCYEIKWFDIKNLPENTTLLVKHVLLEISNGNIYSEFGWK